jgi:hypothetical protein
MTARIRAASLFGDLLCSGTDPACGRVYPGARVDEVVVGRQA